MKDQSEKMTAGFAEIDRSQTYIDPKVRSAMDEWNQEIDLAVNFGGLTKDNLPRDPIARWLDNQRDPEAVKTVNLLDEIICQKHHITVEMLKNGFNTELNAFFHGLNQNP